MSKPAPARPYVSRGQVLQSPPFSAKIRNFLDSAALFLGLYATTLFSLDPWESGRTSAYNVNNRGTPGSINTGRGFFGGGSGGNGGGRGGGPGGGRKLGTVADVRGPECKSCG